LLFVPFDHSILVLTICLVNSGDSCSAHLEMAFQETEKLPGRAYQPEGKTSTEEQHDGEKPLKESLPDPEAEKETSDMTTFPERGARAYSVAIGAAGLLFCTFGYVNAFG
jgi:hypothetical protein